jgi:hypothetical protein
MWWSARCPAYKSGSNPRHQRNAGFCFYRQTRRRAPQPSWLGSLLRPWLLSRWSRTIIERLAIWAVVFVCGMLPMAWAAEPLSTGARFSRTYLLAVDRPQRMLGYDPLQRPIPDQGPRLLQTGPPSQKDKPPPKGLLSHMVRRGADAVSFIPNAVLPGAWGHDISGDGMTPAAGDLQRYPNTSELRPGRNLGTGVRAPDMGDYPTPGLLHTAIPWDTPGAQMRGAPDAPRIRTMPPREGCIDVRNQIDGVSYGTWCPGDPEPIE